MAKKVEKKIELKEPIFIADSDFCMDRADVLFEFPREFRREWFRQLDWRFIMILLVTLILEVGLLLLLRSYTKNYEQHVDLNKIQKQFAHLLLENFSAEDFFALENNSKNTALVTSTERAVVDISAEEIPDDSRVEPGAAKTQPSDENLKRERKLRQAKQYFFSQQAARKTENRFTSALTREINYKGLLVYFTDKENSKVDEDILKILSNSEENKKYLLSSMDKMSLERYQKALSKLGSQNDLNSLKGSKAVVSFQEELASLTPLAKIELASASKNVELDYLEVSNISTKKNNKTTRTAEHVTRVLNSHNRAIQDCFNRVIKKNPGLKGKVVVRISVNPQGLVDDVQILASTIQNEKMLSCMKNRIHRWHDFGACDPALGTVSYKQSYIFGY